MVRNPLPRPIVSVCVTTYNHEAYIKDCLISVLSQEIDVPVEVLVGDDGSSDMTGRIVAEVMLSYPGNIQYFFHAENLGPSANYQFLINNATGSYIAHLDGDDHWLPGKLAAQLHLLALHPECSACF